MSFFRSLFSVLALGLATALSAQSTVPTLSTPFAARALAPGGAPVQIYLGNHFSLPGVAGQLVQFDTVLGRFNLELFAHLAPQHAANFLNYVQSGSYTSSFFHRSATFESNGLTSIVQGGGYTWLGTSPATIFEFNPVPLEYNLANARGTIAAARKSDLNSATSQWFINTRDNSTILGPANGGGYSVFGRVLGTGMTVVDAIAAMPRVNAGGAFTSLPVRNYSGGTIATANLAIINSASVITLFPSASGAGTSLLTFEGGNTAPSVVDAGLSGSTLTLTPLAGGAASVILRATDTNGNFVQTAFPVTVPQVVTQGGTAAFVAPETANARQWQLNGLDIVGGTAATLTVANVQPIATGLYVARMTSDTGTTSSPASILGVSTSAKVIGTGSEVGANIVHPNGNTFDQLLLEGAAASFTADAGQITRLSYIDQTDDIVQIEFSGAGTVSLVLTSASGPAAPTKYNQPTVSYMRGHAGIVVAGADETTNLSIFTVGRATANDPTGTYDIRIPPSATNVPANNGSPLFVGHEATSYDGFADVAFVAISSTNGRFGGLRAANAVFLASRGLTGLYAPGVAFDGPVFIADIAAGSEATPVLQIGSGSDVRITSGNLLQPNGRAVQVSGITQLKFTIGSSSHGTIFNAQNNQGVLEQNGVNVTSQIVVNP